MSDFIKLSVSDIIRETPECVQVRLDIPDSQKQNFSFKPGQYLTFRHLSNGEEIRRSYSICSTLDQDYIAVAVKQIPDGRFSTYANLTLKVGDSLESMPPEGNFLIDDMEAENYLFLAAGSGITPIMSMIKTLLATNQRANVTLMYGNKRTASIIFQEELEDLKNIYLQRFNLVHVLSQESGDTALTTGRISPEKCAMLFDKSIDSQNLQGVYLCGPSKMIMDIKDYLIEDVKMRPEQIHFELFNTDDLANNNEYITNKESNKELAEKKCQVTIEVDGRNYNLDLKYGGESILDAALKTGADLPFACKGGVCCTCRAKLLKGEVDMEKNFALEADELAEGYILTCQSHPKTDEVKISFDFK